jgi:(p)ppGpp synthase/HD superfamily hydrolase
MKRASSVGRAVVAAGLLHNVVEDTATSADEIDSLGLAVSRDWSDHRPRFS